MNRRLPPIRSHDTLSADDVAGVLALADEAAQADGAYPLSEHVVLHLRHGGSSSLHLLAEAPQGGELLGYAHVDLGDAAEGPAAELAVRPGARRRGVGGALLDEAVRQAQRCPGPLRLWAHGTGASAHELAAAHGFLRIRQLWQLRRSIYAPLAPVHLPEDITLRSFDAGSDTDTWLALNAASFPELPDQGSWTRTDLEHRMAEPWFDPAGLLIAEDAHGVMVGFVWTKVHGHSRADGHGPTGSPPAHAPIGEIYVLGVAPTARGRGLGRSLTLAGLHHLRALGLAMALLYVDADNTAAIGLYRSLGFAVWDTDTMFRR